MGTANGSSAKGHPDSGQKSIRTSNDEERASELLSNKKHTFEGVLSKNKSDISNIVSIFALTRDTDIRLRISSILISLGIQEPTYFDYLRAEALKVLAHDNDMPWPFLKDSENAQKQTANPVFVKWCKMRRLDFWDVERALEYPKPDTWYYLAAAGNLRYYDLLVKGLHSRNSVIAANAARGLAKIGDPRAVDELLSAGKNASSEEVDGIIQALLYFPEPRAQKAAENYAAEYKDKMIETYRSEMKERGLRAMFQW